MIQAGVFLAILRLVQPKVCPGSQPLLSGPYNRGHQGWFPNMSSKDGGAGTQGPLGL